MGNWWADYMPNGGPADDLGCPPDPVLVMRGLTCVRGHGAWSYTHVDSYPICFYGHPCGHAAREEGALEVRHLPEYMDTAKARVRVRTGRDDGVAREKRRTFRVYGFRVWTARNSPTR